MSVMTIAILPLRGMPARCLCHQLSWRLILPVRAMHMLSDRLVSITSSSSSAAAPTATPAQRQRMNWLKAFLTVSGGSWSRSLENGQNCSDARTVQALSYCEKGPRLHMHNASQAQE